MYIQNYLLCILYLILVFVHVFTLCHKNFHRRLISVFSSALLGETLWTTCVALHQLIEQYGNGLRGLTSLLNLDSGSNFQYNAQFVHIISMNLFILFLLIVAKGWPITRRDMPFKYAFAIFWLFCLTADLINFYWTTLSKSLSSTDKSISSQQNFNTISPYLSGNSTLVTTTEPMLNSTILSDINRLSSEDEESINDFQNDFNSAQHKFSLLLRILIMVYFLLELRATMIIEQEKKKLQFYLNFGALTMVWLFHTLIVYFISLRVDSNWRTELISGCSAAANFIGFAASTRLLWPWNPRSSLFRKRKIRESRSEANNIEIAGVNDYSTISRDTQAQGNIDDSDGDVGRLEMQNLKSAPGGE